MRRRIRFNAFLIGFVALALICFRETAPARGQELEPRIYSSSPVDTNFVVGTFTNSSGNVSLDPSLPLSDVHASIDVITLGYTRTFRLIGKTATLTVVTPYLGGRITADVFGQAAATTRNGFPDLRLRFSANLLGRALTPAEFARRKPSTTLGVGVTVIAPTGTYDPTRLINIGSNRWSFKPEVGVEVPIGKWFADFAAGVWLFGRNSNYYGGQIMQQAPLAVYQVHGGYNFRPGQWLALDAGYIAGGATTVGIGRPLNALSNSRYGLAFSQPLAPGVTAKVSWSHWLSGQFGQNFSTVGAALQYRWIDRP